MPTLPAVLKKSRSAQSLPAATVRPALKNVGKRMGDGAADGAAAIPAFTLKKLPGGLVYVNVTMPGYGRVVRGKTFRYRCHTGKWIDDADEIARINQLAIPPAYTGVWICPLDNGHLQATGIDARGRKQYRYHLQWRALRDGDKFSRLAEFGRLLPRIRFRIDRDMAVKRGKQPDRNAVLATIVRLLDTTCVRVGNDEYARDNQSYGLTTLRNPHAGLRGSVLTLSFKGKSGVAHDIRLDDPQVAAVVRRCQQLPGQELFHYQDDGGHNGSGNTAVRTIGSGDVNDYLRDISGADFTAKDFRTWHGTVRALELTRALCSGGNGPPYRVGEVLAQVAKHLRNTPAVCRKSYVHPAVLELGPALSADPATAVAFWDTLASKTRARKRLAAAEVRLLAFLDGVKTGRKASR